MGSVPSPCILAKDVAQNRCIIRRKEDDDVSVLHLLKRIPEINPMIRENVGERRREKTGRGSGTYGASPPLLGVWPPRPLVALF